MQVQVQKLSPVLVEFDVTLDPSVVRAEVEKSYQALSKNARISGFRPGKAPRNVLKQLFGARVAAEVAQRLMDDTFPQAVAKENLQPVTAPALEPARLQESGGFSYKARVEIVPSVESVSYEGLVAKRPSAEPTREAIDKELEALRRANSTLEPPKDARASAKGDVVTMDYAVEVDGEVIDDAGAKDFQVEVGTGTLLAAIDEAITGKRPGDASEADVEMSGQHPHPRLRAKKAKFKITIKEVKERVLPALDDEFAKDLGSFETLADLEKDVSEKLAKQLKEQAENQVAEQLVVELVRANPIPIPPSLVQRQMELTEQEILTRARRQGQSVTGVGAELRSQIQNDAELKVRAGLLMAEIAKSQGLKIGDAEIEEGIKELAEQSGKNVAKVRAEYRDPKKREMLIGMILENKVLDIIESKAKIEDA